HLFGPVPSRRLGMSLGVDMVPHKVCSFDCVYCECGRTTKLTTDRMKYVPVEKVKEELSKFFNENPDPDYITFSGAGEPTLNSGFGEILEHIRAIKPDIPVAVLTNASLFTDPQVRKELLQATLILPSLDAAIEETFREINCPVNEIHIKQVIDGLIRFRNEFSGKIWLEVFILPGMNNDEQNLQALKEAIGQIRPDRIQLNTLDRPGTVSGLKPASATELQLVKEYFGFPQTEIIAAAASRQQGKAYRQDTESAILETIVRRPCTIEDLSRILGLHINEINKYLAALEEKQKITSTQLDRGVFYQVRK
ncbi:MAG: radical SAM protein, partial [Bacteroidales bacterium]